MWFSFNPITFSTSSFPSFYIWLESIASVMNLHNHSQLIDPSKMSSSDVVAQSAFDVLRLGRSSQFIVARLLCFWTPKTSRSMVNSWEFFYSSYTSRNSFSLSPNNMIMIVYMFFYSCSIKLYSGLKPQSTSMFLFLLNLFESFCL